MSSHNDDPQRENPDSFPNPSDDSLGVPISPPKNGVPTWQPTRGFPDAFAELHGDVRKGQEPPEEQD